MRCLISVIAAIAVAGVAHAGVTYDFRSATTGSGGGIVAGHVDAEGTAFRLTVISGSGPLLKKGTVLISRDGRTLQVVDPAARTYYDLDVSALMGGVSALFGAGGAARITLLNPRVSSRDAGPGGVVSNYPTRRSFASLDCDVVLESMGQKLTAHVHSDSQRWTTDRVDPKYINVLQLQELKSGLADVDRLLEAQAASLKGFPLRQTTTLTIASPATGTMGSSTTTTVSALVEKPLAAGLFTLPPGLRKVRSPLQGMLATP